MRVLVVTDLRVYRDALALALGRNCCFDAVETTSFDALSGSLSWFHPDVVLLDLVDAGMLSIARSLTRGSPAIRIVGIGVGTAEPEILACAEAGIHGIIARDASLEELTDTVSKAMRGEFQCSARVAGAMMRRLATINVDKSSMALQVNLTTRQTDIVRCLEAGLSNKEIARRLGIQLGTVKNHVHLLLEKLGAARRSDAIARLRRAGWFDSTLQ
jgi:two-component system, NarL family, nitrate/nitrite response regulator NarL